MTRVMVVGDTHRNLDFATNVVNAASSSGINTIIQVGDFGFDFRSNFINVWCDWLSESDERVMYWLDGNHDDHDYIDAHITQKALGEVDTSQPVAHWHERMYYCPRGSVATIGTSNVMFMGGAYSIDKDRRTPGVSWWPQETITYGDIVRAMANAEGVEIDTIFSHDCPNTIWFKRKLNAEGYKVDAQSQANRDLLTELVDIVKPKRVIHGHYHDEYIAYLNDRRTTVFGLAADQDFMTGRTKKAVWGDNVIMVNL